jgi:glycosyltransferase involved in cell wall biosynthesis
MARRDLLRTDASDAERSSLESALRHQLRAEDTTTYQSVEEALKDASVFEVKTTRDVTRVLFVSRDESLLNPDQQSLDGYTNIADLFDEVHILILRQGIPTKTPVLRVADNVWLYTATSKYWWWTPIAGKKLAHDQLVFAEGFRPDLIVARDPFESAVVAYLLGKQYERPVQVHVLENYFAPEFLLEPGNRWRRMVAKVMLRRIPSVRVVTRVLYDMLAKQVTIPDLAFLPRFNNYEALMKLSPTLDLKEKYKPFVFIILYIGRLNRDSAFSKALDGARFGLRNPRLGLIVIGNGSARKEFEERARMLQVHEQVVFETQLKESEIIPYLKSANVLIVPDTTPESEEIVLRGAAAGIPLVLARTPAREDIFVDGESALLCDPDTVDDYSLKLNIVLNDVVLRRQMVEAAQDMIRAKFHENKFAYESAYRESIEQVLFLSELVADTEKRSVPESS